MMTFGLERNFQKECLRGGRSSSGLKRKMSLNPQTANMFLGHLEFYTSRKALGLSSICQVSLGISTLEYKETMVKIVLRGSLSGESTLRSGMKTLPRWIT